MTAVPHRTRAAALALLVGIGAVAACGSSSSTDVDVVVADALQARQGADVILLAMRVSPDEHMEALFQGDVVLDDAGCLRLDSPDAPTVIWPRGWDFEDGGGTIRILDAAGALVGRVGEAFELGGGEVPSLPQAMGFTQADRDLAEQHCPGRYWIVGEVVGH